jgi:hypothetical protein
MPDGLKSEDPNSTELGIQGIRVPSSFLCEMSIESVRFYILLVCHCCRGRPAASPPCRVFLLNCEAMRRSVSMGAVGTSQKTICSHLSLSLSLSLVLVVVKVS